MIISIDRIIFQLIYFMFLQHENFTDSGLTNFGKFLENVPALNSISLNSAE